MRATAVLAALLLAMVSVISAFAWIVSNPDSSLDGRKLAVVNDELSAQVRLVSALQRERDAQAKLIYWLTRERDALEEHVRLLTGACNGLGLTPPRNGTGGQEPHALTPRASIVEKQGCTHTE